MDRKDRRPKTKLDLSKVSILSVEKDKHGHKVYTINCKNTYCSGVARVRKDNPHEGFCKACGDKPKRKRPYETLYNIFLKSAGVNGIAVLLSYEEFKSLCEDKICHYCDAPTIRSEFKNSNWSTAYMIDRKDNTLPYTKDNCVSCCWECNDLKSNKFSYDEFLKLRSFIKKEFGR